MKLLRRRNLAGLRSAKWAETLEQYGVKVLAELPRRAPEHSILVTGCSRAKKSEPDFPQFLYLGQTIKQVFRYSEAQSWSFGVMSDKHGIVFPDERIAPYDTSPSDLSERDLWNLGQFVGERLRAHLIRSVYYIQSPPSMALPYVVMLLAADVKVFFCTDVRSKSFAPQTLLDSR